MSDSNETTINNLKQKIDDLKAEFDEVTQKFDERIQMLEAIQNATYGTMKGVEELKRKKRGYDLTDIYVQPQNDNQ